MGASADHQSSRGTPDIDGDQRRRAGRRQHAVGQPRRLSRSASAPGDRVDREPLAGRAVRDRHRSRCHALLQPRGDDHGRRAIGGHDGRAARGSVRHRLASARHDRGG